MRFVIIKTSALGDILHAFPVISYLKNKMPQCTIDWVSEREGVPLLQAHPSVDSVIEVDTKEWRKTLFIPKTWGKIGRYRQEVRKKSYDVAFDLQGNIKSALLLSCVRAHNKVGFGKKTLSEWPNLFFTHTRFNPPVGMNIREDYLYLVKKFFSDTGSFECDPVVLQADQIKVPTVNHTTALVCPGAAWASKRASIATLVGLLKNRPEEKIWLVWGNVEEKKVCQKIAEHFPGRAHVLEKLSLPKLQNLMDKVDVVVAMDSLALHLGATTNTPTISFFGPSNPKKYAPLGKGHKVIQGKCPYGVSFEKRCPHLRTCNTHPCITSSQFSSQ